MKELIYLFVSALLLASCATAPPSPEIQELIQKAEAGDTESQFKLGGLYDFGHGVPRSGKDTEKWYRLAAEAGHSEAQNSMGSIYQAEERYGEALVWYEKSAAQNNELATNNLAYLYDLGLGVSQDRQKAHELYLKSANLGEPQAMHNLGQMYGSGQLGEEDLINGCAWTFRAVKYSRGADSMVHKPATATAAYCERTLNKKDLLKAKEVANSWQPSSPSENWPNKNSNRTVSPPVL